LEQVIADWRGDAQALRRQGHERDATFLEQRADEVVESADEYLVWLSEEEALLRSGRTVSWLRKQFPQWERGGHARREGKRRFYRMLVIPQRANTISAQEAGYRAALEGAL
jgi:hypothetical protein